MSSYSPAAPSMLVSLEDLERVIDRFSVKYRPYSSLDCDGFLADFDDLEHSGVEVVRRSKSGETHSMLAITVRGSAGAMEIIEARWRDTLRLAGESAHAIAGDQFRFVTRGRAGGTYVTGTVWVETR